MGAGLSTGHWDAVHRRTPAAETSWYEPEPATSLRLALASAPPPGRVVDVGAGRALLADALVEHGYDVTVLDLSGAALATVRDRLGAAVRTVEADVLAWEPPDAFDLWHDRAAFHFLVAAADRDRYAALAAATVRPGGALVLGVFAQDGPEQCSGLPTCRYDDASLAACFGPAFVLEHSEREEHRTPWGAVQPFTWVVLRRR